MGKKDRPRESRNSNGGDNSNDSDDWLKQLSSKEKGASIGKKIAEKSGGLFSPEDWMCKSCGNINWARRHTCNMCNAPKLQKAEERTGAGGGYNERDGIEYKDRQESDDEFDEFGRKKKKFRGHLKPGEVEEGKSEVSQKRVRNKDKDGDEEVKNEGDDDDDEDEDGFDASKYDLDEVIETKDKNTTTKKKDKYDIDSSKKERRRSRSRSRSRSKNAKSSRNRSNSRSRKSHRSKSYSTTSDISSSRSRSNSRSRRKRSYKSRSRSRSSSRRHHHRRDSPVKSRHYKR